MSDTTLNRFVASGTTAERLAFTPAPPTPASGPDPGYTWFDTDDSLLYAWDGANWVAGGSGSGTVTNTGTLTAFEVIVGNAGVDVTALGSVGSLGEVLTSQGAGANPQWAAASGGSATFTSALASPPASPASGDLWLPTDSVYLYRYSGAAWVPWGPLFPLTEPDSTTFTWINQGTATISTTGGGVYLKDANTGGNSLAIRKLAAPAAPYVLTAALMPLGIVSANFGSLGILFRESGSGKLSTLEYIYSSGQKVAVEHWSGPTAFVGTDNVRGFTPVGGVVWFRIEDDNTDRNYSISADGQHWYEIYTEARTTYLTANELGFFVNANGIDVETLLLSWKVT